MNKFRHFINAFHYAGLTKQEMSMCANEIKRRNAFLLSLAYPVFIGALLVLFIVSLFPGTGEGPNMVLYLVFTILLGIQALIFFLFFFKNNKYVLIMSYLFMMTAYAFGTYEATCLGPSSSITVMCVFLVVVPLLVIDVPVRLSILTVLAEAALLITRAIVINVDPTLGSYIDKFLVIESIFCTTLGIVLAITIQKTKFSDIRNHLMLEVQRDHDLMTGAKSRFAYIRDVGLMTDQGEQAAGVIFADVNGLKITNDTKGHEAGDRLIRNAYSLMRKYFHEDYDCIYRIGGDEFVIISLGGNVESFDAKYAAMSKDDKNHEIISCGSVWLDKVNNAMSAIKKAERLMYLEKGKYYDSHPDKDRRIN